MRWSHKLGGGCTPARRRRRLPLGKPPTGFLESNVGRPPNLSVTDLTKKLNVSFRRSKGTEKSIHKGRFLPAVEMTMTLFGQLSLKNRCRIEYGMTDRLCGKPPYVECDVGLVLDELVSSELETTRLADDDVRNDSCLAMDSTMFQLCQN